MNVNGVLTSSTSSSFLKFYSLHKRNSNNYWTNISYPGQDPKLNTLGMQQEIQWDFSCGPRIGTQGCIAKKQLISYFLKS